MNIVTPADFEDRMKEIANRKDTEGRHVDADKLLCEVLNSLGYEAGVEIYEKIGKWYA